MTKIKNKTHATYMISLRINGKRVHVLNMLAGNTAVAHSMTMSTFSLEVGMLR